MIFRLNDRGLGARCCVYNQMLEIRHVVCHLAIYDLRPGDSDHMRRVCIVLSITTDSDNFNHGIMTAYWSLTFYFTKTYFNAYV